MNIEEHMVTEKDDTHYFPVIDCPVCEVRNMILQVYGPFTNQEGELEEIWYCPFCSYVPYSMDNEAKGYVDIDIVSEFDMEQVIGGIDFEKMG